MIETLVVLGGTGDLAGRFLLPAVAALQASGALGCEFHVVGAGDQAFSQDEYRSWVGDRLARHAPQIPGVQREALTAALRYRQMDVTDPAVVADGINSVVAESGPGPLACYLALPTQLMLGAVQAVIDCQLPAGSRVAIEKPFGQDLPSAIELNAALRRYDASERQPAVYRVDHALAMTALQGLPRAVGPGTDRRIEWNGGRIERVVLLWEETLALEGRAAFYDRAGALRDVMQNHLLQVLCAIAQPQDPDDASATDDPAVRREALLRTVRPLDEVAIHTYSRRARYTGGQLAEDVAGPPRTVPDYTAEDGVDPLRQTETFAEVVLEIDSPQWEGTRFVLRAGKALAHRRRGVRVHLRPAAGTGTDDDEPVWLDLDTPDPANVPPVDGAHRAHGADESGPYHRLIGELLAGGSSYAVGAAEAELCWQVFQPVLDAWSNNTVPLGDYPAGSSGPSRAR